MPLYQYSLAAVYFFFGHLFWAGQLFSVLLAVLTVVFASLAAWEVYECIPAVLFVGAGAAVSTQLRLFVLIPQVENLYVAVFAFSIWMWARYWRRKTIAAAIWLGLAAGLVVNTRSQGAFYCAAIVMAPLFVPKHPLRARFAQFIIAAAIGLSTLIPWTVRNYVCDHRLSPMSEQTVVVLLFSHPGVAGYGLRHDLTPWGPILRDYIARYGDQYGAAITKDFIVNTLRRPSWFMRALWWRTVAFYGMLPPGFMAPQGPQPTNWSAERQWFISQKWPEIFLIVISLLALALRFCRTTLFLTCAVLGNLAILVFGSQVEGRMWLPLTTLHLLIGAAILFSPREEGWASSISPQFMAWERSWKGRTIWAAACLLIVALSARFSFGAALNKPVREWSVLEAECVILSNRHPVSRTGPPIYWMRMLKGCVVADPRFPPSMRRVPIIRQTQNR